MPWPPMSTAMRVAQSVSYASCHGELAQTSATTTAASSTTPPADSVWRKSRSGRSSSGPSPREWSPSAVSTAGF